MQVAQPFRAASRGCSAALQGCHIGDGGSGIGDGGWALTSVALLLALAGCSRASEPRAAPVIQLADCELPGVNGPARCGAYEVWEDREAAAGRRIELRLVVLPARGAERAADPVFYFAGGPGASAIGAAVGIAALLRPVNESRDLVFVDIRGTGRSRPLGCPIHADEEPLQRYFDEFLADDYVRNCLAAQQTDVRFYTHPIAMDDINEVRAALGYQQINLYGASGGTRQAQLYARRHAASVRTIVLHGVQPMDAEMPLSFARALDHGIGALIGACRESPACHATYPDLAADWEQSRRRFESGFAEAEVSHPSTGRREGVRITRGVYADGVRHLLYDTGRAWEVPALIHSAARGDFGPFAQRELAQALAYSRLLQYGMFLSTTCAEDVTFIDDDDIRRATEGTFLGDYRVRRQQAACRIWPRGAGIDAGFQQPLRSTVPVLVLSGDADVATPPADAERAIRDLPNARHIVFPNQSHAFSNPACAGQLILAFVTVGSASGLETSCVAATRRPPFTPGAE